MSYMYMCYWLLRGKSALPSNADWFCTAEILLLIIQYDSAVRSICCVLKCLLWIELHISITTSEITWFIFHLQPFNIHFILLTFCLRHSSILFFIFVKFTDVSRCPETSVRHQRMAGNEKCINPFSHFFYRLTPAASSLPSLIQDLRSWSSSREILLCCTEHL